MKKSLTLALALLLLFTCIACGGAGPDVEPEEAYVTGSSGQIIERNAEEGMCEPEMAYDTDGEVWESIGDQTGGSVYDRTDAKLIRRAELTIETLEFQEASAILDAMVQSYNGYYESSDVWGGAYEGALRSGHYVVRIPSKAYDSFMNAVGDVGHQMRRIETTEDVGEEYFDTEIRLETLKIKHERLLALLEKATDMESIVALQGYLSDVEYEIDALSGALRRYDGLVDYATIVISLEERTRLSSDAGEKASFGTQFGTAFSNGLGSAGHAVQSFLLWCAYHFVALLLLAAVVIAAVVILRKKLRGHSLRSKRPVPPDGSLIDAPAEIMHDADFFDEEDDTGGPGDMK